MTEPLTSLPNDPQRAQQLAREERVMMSWSLAFIFFAGIGFVALWAALIEQSDIFTYVGAFVLLICGGIALLLAGYEFSKRVFALLMTVGIAVQVVLTLHFDQGNTGFYLLLPAFYTVVFFWRDRAVLVSALLVIVAAFVAEPLLVGGETALARVVTTTPIFLALVLTTGHLGAEAAQMRSNRGRFESTISSLLVALQERDGYTADHSEETVELALAVGERLGIDEDERTVLADVALLHDIGKIGIPNEILNKTGGLDAGEWEFMKRHPEIGERIVAPVPGFSEVAKAIRHEHERWDGTGYPDGISGAEIPLASRIVLVCDAFHAMITDRPYRKSIGMQAARSELVSNSGSQFDPTVVSALLDVLDNEGLPESVGRARWTASGVGAGAVGDPSGGDAAAD